MDDSQQKAQAFVKRLLENPALASLPALQKEEQILNFIKLNATQLAPTLSSPNFFPNQNWQQILYLLYQALTSIINDSLYPQLSDAVDKIDYAFISLIRQQNFPLSQCKVQIEKYLKTILQNFEARRLFTGSFIAYQHAYVDKYLDRIFESKQYIHIELTRAHRMKMGRQEIKNLIKASMLLRIAIYHLTLNDPKETIERTSGLVRKPYADKILDVLKNELKLLPEELLVCAVNSNLSFQENSQMEGTSRIAAILAARCQNFKVITKVDRGAETPDKSWFNIARKNYKFYGFDLKMVEEFYRIAAENGW